MKKIKLTQGYFALIDNDDYEKVTQYEWHIQRKKQNKKYAVAGIGTGIKYKRTTLRMHRLIMNAPMHMQVDHINGNGLDNRKSNLRLTTNQMNQANKGINKNNTSGYKGVTFNKQCKKYLVQITFNHENIYLGLYDSPIEAAKAYDKKAFELFGEYARLNFPLSS